MPTRRALFIDADYIVKDGQTFARLLVKGKKATRLLHPYDPYFYADVDENERGAIESLSIKTKDGRAIRPKRTEFAEKLLSGERKRLLRIFCHEPRHVPILRDAIPFPCYESEIPFGRRFMMDFGLVPFSVVFYEREGRIIKKFLKSAEGDPSMLRRIAFDTEVYNPSGVPRPSRDPVIMLSFCGSAGEKGVITYKTGHKDYIEMVQNEKELLERFFAILDERDADVLFGYNTTNFDLPYMHERARKLGIPLALGRDGSPFRTVKKGLISPLEIRGRVHIDLYPVMKFFGFTGLIRTDDYTLKNVYSAVTGKNATRIERLDIWRLWDNGNIPALAEYALADALATMELGEIAFPLLTELSTITRLPLFDVAYATSGQLVESLLMSEAASRNMVIPPKPGGAAVAARMENPIQGAYVKLPAPGIYGNIAVFDFRGLYPSIICSYNIDPFTIDREGDSHTSPTGARFLKSPKGLIPLVLEGLIDRRAIIKRQLRAAKRDTEEYKRLSARSHALKILANSIAGDEPLLLLDPKGSVRIVKASDFIDPRLKREYIGETQLGDAGGWKAACFLGGKIRFREIKKVMRHKARKLLKIKLKSGRCVRVTEDHSLFTVTADGFVKPAKAFELTGESTVLVPRKMVGLKPKAPPEKLNLIRLLMDAPDGETEDLMLTVRLGQKAKLLTMDNLILRELDENGANHPTAIGKSIGSGYRSISKHMEKLADKGFVEKSNASAQPPHIYGISSHGREYKNFISHLIPHLRYNGNTRRHYIMFNDIKEHIYKIPEAFFEDFEIGPVNGSKIKPFVKITPALARLLGYYVSEGYTRKWLNKTGGYSYRVELTNYSKKILKDMEECFRELGVKVERTDRTVQSNTKMAYLLFKYIFDAGSSAYEKEVPGIVLNGEEEFQKEFLYAYFLGDGSFEKKQKRYKFTTVSKKLVDGITFLLSRLGISEVSISKDSRFYRIYVWGEIPFIGLNRNKKTNRHVFNSIPGKYIEKEIRELGDVKYFYAIKKRISKKQLELFYSAYKKRHGHSGRIERLLALFKSDLAVDQIERLEKQDKEEYVYDLSVDKAENFIGGAGWVCLHNSFYGYLGYARSRWYNRKCAESVTAWGRMHILDAERKAAEAGFTVIYIDTDSLVVLLGEKTREDAFAFLEKINKELPGKMELELEGFYSRGVFVSKKAEEKGAKKKYALLGDDGRIKIRGFELVRRDWSGIAKDTQRRVLEAILREGSKDKAVSIVREVVESLRSGKAPLPQLAIYTQLKKEPEKYEVLSPELSAAQKARKRGKQIERGSIVGYVITRKGKSISEKAELLEFAPDYDPNYYINNQVLPAVMKILRELGVDEYELTHGGKQKGLGEFV